LDTINPAIANDRGSFFSDRAFGGRKRAGYSSGPQRHSDRVQEENSAEPVQSKPIDAAELHDLSANQIAMTTRATMMVPHTAGVTRFVLPLRGESLAAWSNFMCGTFSTEADLQK
jgi:hypothetical protein